MRSLSSGTSPSAFHRLRQSARAEKILIPQSPRFKDVLAAAN
jgi:hypothetical protein